MHGTAKQQLGHEQKTSVVAQFFIGGAAKSSTVPVIEREREKMGPVREEVHRQEVGALVSAHSTEHHRDARERKFHQCNTTHEHSQNMQHTRLVVVALLPVGSVSH